MPTMTQHPNRQSPLVTTTTPIVMYDPTHFQPMTSPASTPNQSMSYSSHLPSSVQPEIQTRPSNIAPSLSSSSSSSSSNTSVSSNYPPISNSSSFSSNYIAPSMPSSFPLPMKPHTQPLSTEPPTAGTRYDHYTAPVAIVDFQNGSLSSSVTGALSYARVPVTSHLGLQQPSAVLVSGYPLPHTQTHHHSSSQQHFIVSSPAASSELQFQRHPMPHSAHQHSPQLPHAQAVPHGAISRRATDPELTLPRHKFAEAPPPSAATSGKEYEHQDLSRRYSSPAKIEGKVRSRLLVQQQLPPELVAEQSSEEQSKDNGEEESEVTGTSRVGEGRPQGGYDYPFVSRANTEEYNCPICFLVLREPFLTDCCGHHFCHSCIDSVKHSNQPCPICTKKGFNVMVDRGVERKVRELKVRCPQFLKGCRWLGTLGGLEEHIDHIQGNCQFITVSCHLGCGQRVPLSNLDHHMNDECPRRPYSCKFCGHKGIFEEIPQHHWPECKGYPVACPNECGTPDLPRRDLDEHVSTCPCRSVSCEFAYAGCTTMFPFNTTEKHMKEETQVHISLLSKQIQQLLAGKDSNKSETKDVHVNKGSVEENEQLVSLTKMLKEREGELEQVKLKVDALQEEVEELRCDIVQLRSVVLVPPFYFRVQEVSRLRTNKEQWFSPPFYTHVPNGYKMCISVDCGGSDEGLDTHLSVYANLVKGEHDDSLRWPFRGLVTVRLVNQQRDSTHCEHDIPFVRDTPLEIAGRVTAQDIAESGLGVPKFLHLSKLAYNSSENVEYLRNDTLQFCVTKVRVDFRK